MELGPSRKMLPIIARMMGYVPASAGDLRKQFGSGSIQFLRTEKGGSVTSRERLFRCHGEFANLVEL